MAVTSTDLQTYLGLASIEDERADQLIALANALCVSMVDPVPDAPEGFR